MRKKNSKKRSVASKSSNKSTAKKSVKKTKSTAAKKSVNGGHPAALTSSKTADLLASPSSDFFVTTFGKVRHIFVWSLLVVMLFAALSLISNAVPSSTQPEPFRMQQASTLTLLTGESNDVTLIATGDILLARYIELKMRALNDYTYPFQKVSDVLKSADITFGNLETPLFAGPNTPEGSMTFRGDIQGIEGLQFAGYDAISVANNHSMNYREAGLLKTVAVLKKGGIEYVGGGHTLDRAHTPAVFEVKEKKVAIYAYVDPNIPPREHGAATPKSPGVALMDIEAVKNDVKNALAYADIVVVSMHAGREYSHTPTKFQQEFAHAAIDAGASAVIGHHTHFGTLPYEMYGNGVIFYSLGNFVFDQFFSEDVQIGLIAKLTFGDDSTEAPKVEVIPVRIVDGQPRILEGEEAKKALERMTVK